jgi:hypothetical protein
LKVFKKVALYVLVTFLVIVAGLTASVFLFKDRIIQEFIRQANKHLNTPVKIEKLDVSILQSFPSVSIVCRGVEIEDSHPGEYPLFTANKVSFQLNPIEIWGGTYIIKGLIIQDSETHLKINRSGEANYNIFKKDTVQANTESLSFSLENLIIKNSVVTYADKKLSQDFEFLSDELKASVESSKDVYLITTKGDVFTRKFKTRNTSILSGKDFLLEATLRYFDGDKRIVLEPSIIRLNAASFTVKGEYDWRTRNTIDLTAQGENTDIQTLLSLLPTDIAASLEKYQSSGNIYFNGSLRGAISDQKLPGVSVEFGFENATFFHPDYKTRIENASLTGSYATSNLNDPSSSALIFKNVSGSLNGHQFESNLIFRNFEEPEVIFDFKGELDVKSLLEFYPIEKLTDASGSIDTDIAFEGKLSWLKSKATSQKATATGTIDLNAINFLYGPNQVAINGLNGSLQFNNNDLALSNVGGRVGKSDFVMNGFFKNIITFLLFENQPIGIETDLSSSFIDLDELFSFGFSSEKKSEDYTFSISPNLYLNFNCNVQRLNYKRFHASDIKGDLLVKNQVAVSRNLAFSSMRGSMTLNGILDATNPKAIDVSSAFKLNSVSIDSVFYVFENFGQEFIQDKHLKGFATADVNLELVLNQNLRLFSETLIADVNTVIQKGELNHFEPMKKLDKYLDDEGLDRLRFADLKNEIHIENKTIYIPQMEIRSNVTALQLSGTHTFDQQINYRIVAPLVNKRKIDIEQAGTAVEELEGRTKLFLKITGTTDNYRVQYDTDAVKKKIVSDLKREVKELKDAFRLKGQKKKKELEVTDEEFDWDNEQ